MMSLNAVYEHGTQMKKHQTKTQIERLVGLGRLELPTLRLSGVRSNHLSYKPILKGLHPSVL